MSTVVEQPQNSPFLKQLASSDSRTRTSALESLRTYLRGHGAFSEIELLKLWKGLFYTMWMSDRTRTQQRLAADLADLVDVVREENVVIFLEVFWKTMAREISGIDALRMDKFLLLVRLYLAAEFAQVLRHPDTVSRHLDVLSTIPLNAADARIPNGLRYHVLDIYVDELAKADPDKKISDELLEQILTPVRRIARDSPTKLVRKRAKETLDDERVRDWRGEGTAQSEAEVATKEDVTMAGDAEEQQKGDNDDEWGGIAE